MKTVVYINSQINSDYLSNLFLLFSSKFSLHVELRPNFQKLSNIDYSIFTAISAYESNLRTEKKINQFGLILDANKVRKEHLPEILKADFCFVIGRNDFLEQNIKKFPSLTLIPSLHIELAKEANADMVIGEYCALPNIYEKFLNNQLSSDIKYLHIFINTNESNTNFYKEIFSRIGIKLHFYWPNYGQFENILNNSKAWLEPISNNILTLANQVNSINSDNCQSISVDAFANKLINRTHLEVLKHHQSDIVNIICFNPTYLFKDLVDRFIAKGCVHSDFPLPNAKAYIWMRPQEVWHYEFLLKNKSNKEISETYKAAYNKLSEKNINISEIKRRSVAIHHGTCYEPLYQFDYTNLAKSLFTVHSVVGVCEFEECYGPSHIIANQKNFIFVPIGYDHTLFNKNFWKTDAKPAQSPLKIGFVGRAYGTTNKIHLKKSQLSEPKGYRKGGDLCLDIALRLKATGTIFELHILGQNWEELIEQFDKYKIPYKYYARDKNITYTDYPSVYSLMDILLISARCEGGPVSAIEALSLGVNVVSTDVGVVKFLYNNPTTSIGCNAFEYDKKWHIADIELAVNHIESIYNKKITSKDRQNIRDSVSIFTTDNWVTEIIRETERI